MAYLRPARSRRSPPAPKGTSLDAFDGELEYLFETLRRLGASPREIEDLAQEVFVVLHRNWHSFDTTRPVRPYLFGVAFRIVHAHRRRRGREILTSGIDTEDGALSPENALQAKESVALLHAALDRIPLSRRAVIIMHDLDGISVTEIARRLSISRFGTYARLRKARKELAVAVRRVLKEGR